MTPEFLRKLLLIYFSDVTIQTLLLVISILALMVTIFRTYNLDKEDQSNIDNITYFILDLIILIIMIFDYIMNVYISINKKKFIFSWLGINNFFAIISIILNLVPLNPIFILVFRYNRTSLISIYLKDVLKMEENSISREVFFVISGAFSFLLLSSGLILLLSQLDIESFQ